ncbi:hypothetical protein [Snuella lapsa]|uniref:hypothetical protein n=1 Tax=Snuella lapsa TaxID=870481 RepID=UPI0031EBD5E8
MKHKCFISGMTIGCLLIISNIILSCSSSSNEETRTIDSETHIGLQNAFVKVTFKKKTGQIDSICNKSTQDNYIKNEKGGNIFRLFANTTSMPYLRAGAQDNAYGGILIDPHSCSINSYSVKEGKDLKTLEIVYIHENTQLQVTLKVELHNASGTFDTHLAVKNVGSKPVSVYTAFPYFTGICLGSDKNTNLTVNMWDRGYPGVKAWERPIGGIYGKDVSMQWQTVYEPVKKQGFAFIVQDKDFSNKVMSTFPEGGMASFYFDKKRIDAGKAQIWPSAKILAYNGNWRTAAKAYHAWFSGNIETRKVPNWYKEEVTTRSSTWFPDKKAVAKNMETGQENVFTSFEQLHGLFSKPIFGNDINDCMEIAMWNEGVNRWPETYGPWMSSGFIDFRSDLGGLEAFKKGVETCHKYGRRVAMYVAAYGARKTSPMFEGDWEKFAIKNRNGKPVLDYRQGDEIYGAFNCPGYKPWQDNLIRVCTMLAKAGVDEIRLDEFGFPFRPCYNEVHAHESPFNANKWMRDCLKRIREATDKINPDFFISTEFYMDYFHESTNGALIMDCSGSEIDAMKVAMPNYLPLSYHASAPEAAITGAIMSKTENQRRNWAWSKVGTEKPDDYNEDFVIDLRWHELHPTFANAVTYGDVTEWDPVAENDSKWMGHLWKSEAYWVLTGGHVDATPLKEDKVLVRLPELPENVKVAYEFNVETLEMNEVSIQHNDKGTYVALKSAVSAVLFPLPNCPALPIINQHIEQGQEVKITVSLFAPWQKDKQKTSLNNIECIAPGFHVEGDLDGDTRIFTIPLTEMTPEGKFYYTVTGDCLKVKRWFEINR